MTKQYNFAQPRRRRNFLSASRLFFLPNSRLQIDGSECRRQRVKLANVADHTHDLFFRHIHWSTLAGFILAYWPPPRSQSILLLPSRFLTSVTWIKCKLELFCDCSILIMTPKRIKPNSERDKYSPVLNRKQVADIVIIVLQLILVHQNLNFYTRISLNFSLYKFYCLIYFQAAPLTNQFLKSQNCSRNQFSL